MGTYSEVPSRDDSSQTVFAIPGQTANQNTHHNGVGTSQWCEEGNPRAIACSRKPAPPRDSSSGRAESTGTRYSSNRCNNELPPPSLVSLCLLLHMYACAVPDDPFTCHAGKTYPSLHVSGDARPTDRELRNAPVATLQQQGFPCAEHGGLLIEYKQCP